MADTATANLTTEPVPQNMTSEREQGPESAASSPTATAKTTILEHIQDVISQDNYNIVLTLKNGKSVSLADCGDPDGIPVMFFIGLAGTRHFAYVTDKLARECKLRLIVPDRPGTGLSDDVHHDDKTAMKWTEIVSEIADQLKVDKFGIIAQSCGAVYALACAMKIPHRILGTIHLVSPWVPLSSPGTSKSLKFAQWMPKFVLRASSACIQSIPQAAVSMGSINSFCSGWSEAEQKSFRDPEEGLKFFFEATLKLKKHENNAGHTNDIMMCMEKNHSFGFEYSQVNYPVHIFHGTKDGMVPIGAVQLLETSMPNCKLSIRDLATHNLICDQEYVREVVFPSLKATVEEAI